MLDTKKWKKNKNLLNLTGVQTSSRGAFEYFKSVAQLETQEG